MQVLKWLISGTCPWKTEFYVLQVLDWFSRVASSNFRVRLRSFFPFHFRKIHLSSHKRRVFQ